MLSQTTSSSFFKIFGAKPYLTVRAPGRINLIGEHVDYNFGFVLPAAIDRAIWFSMGKRSDGELHFHALDLQDSYHGDVSAIKKSEKNWANYLLGVISEAKLDGLEAGGMNVVFAGEIPLGAGLSSSAALESGMLAGLNELFGWGLPKIQIVKLAQRGENMSMMPQFSNDPPPPGLHIRTCVNSVNPLNWLKIGLELRHLRPDLIVPRYWLPFMGPCLGSILRIAKGNGHTKAVAIADNVLPHEQRPGDRAFTRYFVKACDAFIVMSKSVLDDLRIFTQKPAAVIPHPIYDNYGEHASRELALAQLGLPSENRYLLFFGFIRDYKGLDLLLEAMADERIRKMNLKLIVAGEYYGNQEKYEAQIRSLGIENQLVMRTDYIPNEQVRRYFGAADLVVQPYRTATQSGISQMAYHFEKPMVVTDVGGLAEIVPDGKAGYVVPVDAKSIADAIVDFFENDRAAAFSKGVAEGKKRFSWKAMVEGVLSIAEPQSGGV